MKNDMEEMPDLFNRKKDRNPAEIQPLAYQSSPKEFNEFEGQQHILAPGTLLRRAIIADRLGSAIFFGPPGTGKSALARLIALKTRSEFIELNAVTAGVADLRKVIESAKIRQSQQGKKTIVLIDEIHHFNRSQQDALLPDVEKGNIAFIGITTENPYFYVNAALRSRSQIFEFFPLGLAELKAVLGRAVQFLSKKEPPILVEISGDAQNHILSSCNGDARKLLNSLEIGATTTPKDSQGIVRFTLEVAQASTQKKAILYDKSGDEHYDTISAFIKSMRGSDADAALFWLAKMLEAGEDPRFIARRIVICASEDVGNANPQALVVANAAFQTVELIGMPEARITLAQAAIYVASSPKSNASYIGIEKALREVKSGPLRQVPNHLKDSNLDKQARAHGKGYQYPHNFPNHWVDQDYMPQPKTFYEPTDLGEEKKIKEWLKEIRKGSAPNIKS